MPRNRFVDPNVVRLALSDDDWIEVKRRISYGDQQRIISATIRTMKNLDEEVGIDPGRHRLARMQVWLTDWSFRDSNGKSVPLSNAAIANLDEETADEIDKALDGHVRAIEQEKKDQASHTTVG